MAAPAPQVPFCPTCGTPAVWHAPIAQWGCDRCRQMLPGQAPLAPVAPPAPATPPCPRCGTPSVWHPSMNHWGCDVCREMLPPNPVPVQPESAANIFGRIMIVIVLIIVLIVIKLWARGFFR